MALFVASDIWTTSNGSQKNMHENVVEKQEPANQPLHK